MHFYERDKMLITPKLKQYCVNKGFNRNQRPQLRRNTLFLVKTIKKIYIFFLNYNHFSTESD